MMNAPLTLLWIDGYKNLHHFGMAVRKLNVIVGESGVGKTNILEALGFIGAAAHGHVDYPALDFRGVMPCEPSMVNAHQKRVQVRAQSLDSSYSVEIGGGIDWVIKAESITQGRNRQVFHPARDGRSLAALEAVRLGASYPEATALMELLGSYAIFSPDHLAVTGQRTDPLVHICGRGGRNTAQAARYLDTEVVLDLLADDEEGALYPWAESFYVRPAHEAHLPRNLPAEHNVVVFKQRGTGMEIPAPFAGSGAMVPIFAAVLATSVHTPSLLAIDGLDRYLSPAQTRRLLHLMAKWLEGRNKQVLVTCQDPSIAHDKELMDDHVEIVHVGLDDNGNAVLR